VRSVALLALLVAACQPHSRRLLLLDLALSDPLVLDATAAPWHAAGYTVEYRHFYPHLTRQDLTRYRAVVLLGGRAPEMPSDALTLGDLAILTEWARRGGVVVFGYAGDGEGFLDRWIMNRWLAAVGAGIVIGDYALEDTAPSRAPGGAAEPQPRVFPLPQSALDNAGFESFPAGRNHVLLVRRESQVLARSSPTAFVRLPREAPAPRPRAAVAAAARVGEGLILVLSRHALAGLGPDLRPSTMPAAMGSTDASRTGRFLGALARWTRRPAEWASIAPAVGTTPLTLTGGPRPVPVHPPPLAPPPGAGVIALPRPFPTQGPRAGVPSWVVRQGVRGLWVRTPRALDSLLAFVDVGAFNVLATEVPAPARADSLGLRNLWRPTAGRLQATSLRWFPAITLAELRPEEERGGGRGTRELDLRGDTATVWCALDSLFWRAALRPAYRALARLGGGRGDPVAGVALDLDVPDGGYAARGFCDATYHEGLRALGHDSAETARLAALPPAARYDTLLERGLLGRYDEALERLVAQRAAGLRADLWRLNPDLRFVFRSAQLPSDWFSIGLLRGFSTADAPVSLWTRERRVREPLAHYRVRGLFVLSAVGLTPARFAPADWARLQRLAFGEHDGFWLPWSDVTRPLNADSLGRLIRRLAR
jgi:hypothetical protein